MNIHSKYIALSMTLCASPLFAAPLSADAEKAKAFSAAMQYAELVGCGVERGSNIGLPDIINTVFIPSSADNPLSDIEFIVPWAGDVGCLGGTGTYFTQLTAVVYEEGEDKYLIAYDDILSKLYQGEGDFINGRFIESIHINAQGQLEIVAGELQEDDLNNFPSAYFTYVIAPDTADYGQNRYSEGVKIVSKTYAHAGETP